MEDASHPPVPDTPLADGAAPEDVIAHDRAPVGDTGALPPSEMGEAASSETAAEPLVEALQSARAEPEAAAAPTGANAPAGPGEDPGPGGPAGADAPAGPGDATAPVPPAAAAGASTTPASEPRQSGSGVGTALVGLLERAGLGIVDLLRRPRVRTVAIGVLLIVLGAFVIGHSAWTFPVVIVGILMVLVAWMGARMEGRFEIEWGDAGAGVDMHVRFKPSGPPQRALNGPGGSARVQPTARTSVTASTSPAAAATTATSVAPARAANDRGEPGAGSANGGLPHPDGVALSARPAHPEIIEGDAQTIEIDVAELQALIAAAQAGDASQLSTIRAARMSWPERQDPRT